MAWIIYLRALLLSVFRYVSSVLSPTVGLTLHLRTSISRSDIKNTLVFPSEDTSHLWNLLYFVRIEIAMQFVLCSARALNFVMPAASTISTSDKERIKATFPSSTSKILTATLARVYYAHPSPNDWSYTGLQGAMTLVSDKIKGGFWLRLVDLSVSRAL